MIMTPTRRQRLVTLAVRKENVHEKHVHRFWHDDQKRNRQDEHHRQKWAEFESVLPHEVTRDLYEMLLNMKPPLLRSGWGRRWDIPCPELLIRKAVSRRRWTWSGRARKSRSLRESARHRAREEDSSLRHRAQEDSSPLHEAQDDSSPRHRAQEEDSSSPRLRARGEDS